MAAKAPKSVVERVVSRGLSNLTPVEARRILRMKFGKSDLRRIHQLGVRAQSGALSQEERAELEGLLQLSSLLTQMHSRARMSLKRAAPEPRRKTA
jgi:hypothetical protein